MQAILALKSSPRRRERNVLHVGGESSEEGSGVGFGQQGDFGVPRCVAEKRQGHRDVSQTP